MEILCYYLEALKYAIFELAIHVHRARAKSLYMYTKIFWGCNQIKFIYLITMYSSLS